MLTEDVQINISACLHGNETEVLIRSNITNTMQNAKACHNVQNKEQSAQQS